MRGGKDEGARGLPSEFDESTPYLPLQGARGATQDAMFYNVTFVEVIAASGECIIGTEEGVSRQEH